MSAPLNAAELDALEPLRTHPDGPNGIVGVNAERLGRLIDSCRTYLRGFHVEHEDYCRCECATVPNSDPAEMIVTEGYDLPTFEKMREERDTYLRERDEQHEAWSQCNEWLGVALRERDEACEQLALLSWTPITCDADLIVYAANPERVKKIAAVIAAAREWMRCEAERRSYRPIFGVSTPMNDPEMQRMTAEARTANETIRSALAALDAR